jgi:hypothetical protein
LFNNQIPKDESTKEMLENSHHAAVCFICDSLPVGFLDEFVGYTEMETEGRKVDLFLLVENIGKVVKEIQV